MRHGAVPGGGGVRHGSENHTQRAVCGLPFSAGDAEGTPLEGAAPVRRYILALCRRWRRWRRGKGNTGK
ncbi:hypothetical protein NXV03_12595 [Phocaeicola vulgatus]|nr:hypothetical protein [Phocaeicola vulgatus]